MTLIGIYDWIAKDNLSAAIRVGGHHADVTGALTEDVARGFGCMSRYAVFIVVLAVLNVPLICWPRERAPATIAIEIRAAISAYSTAVTAELSATKREKNCRMTCTPGVAIKLPEVIVIC